MRRLLSHYDAFCRAEKGREALSISAPETQIRRSNRVQKSNSKVQEPINIEVNVRRLRKTTALLQLALCNLTELVERVDLEEDELLILAGSAALITKSLGILFSQDEAKAFNRLLSLPNDPFSSCN
jgi:hypothetical protein